MEKHWAHEFSLERNDEKSFVYLVPKDLKDDIGTNNTDENEEILVKLTDWLNGQIGDMTTFPQKGDVVQLSWGEYRNDGTFFVDIINDEVKVIHMEYDIDDYGSPPMNWWFPEFPIKYFEDVIRHNRLVFLSPIFDDEIMNNITFGIPDIEFDIKPEYDIWFSYFEYNNATYCILGNPDSMLFDNINGNNGKPVRRDTKSKEFKDSFEESFRRVLIGEDNHFDKTNLEYKKKIRWIEHEPDTKYQVSDNDNIMYITCW